MKSPLFPSLPMLLVAAAVLNVPPACAAVTDGLVLYLPFSGDAQDLSGNNNHGTVFGAAPAADRNGNPNSAYSFDGVNDYIEIADHATLDFTNSFSIALWINQPVAGGYRVVDKITSGSNDGYMLDTITNGIRMRLCGAGACPESSAEYGLNNWHHLVLTFNNGSAAFFIDGQPSGTSTLPQTAVQTNGLPLYLGSAHPLGYYFQGLIDEVRLYNRVLTGPEILELADYRLLYLPLILR